MEHLSSNYFASCELHKTSIKFLETRETQSDLFPVLPEQVTYWLQILILKFSSTYPILHVNASSAPLKAHPLISRSRQNFPLHPFSFFPLFFWKNSLMLTHPVVNLVFIARPILKINNVPEALYFTQYPLGQCDRHETA